MNALSEHELRNVLSVIRAAFEKPDRIPDESRDPSATLLLLENLANSFDNPGLKLQIAETETYILAK